MGIDTVTLSILRENAYKFSSELNETINILITLISHNSPLSDLVYLLNKSNQSIQGLKIPMTNKYWMPIRNIIRILAHLAKYSDELIISIELGDMFCGCDYFEGDIKITGVHKQINGKYKWQWTKFQESDRSFDKFVVFPRQVNEPLIE
ncbi:MAG: hypothetical protein ACXAD7_02100 [Candidatus Kariarchaeaceae archaeon]|jgi:hypothetical protein